MLLRDTLINISIYNKGEYRQTLQTIYNKTQIPKMNNDYSNYTSKIVTIIDENYPEVFKCTLDCPLVLYYHGNLNLLNSKNILGIIGTRTPSSLGKDILNNIVDPTIAYLTSHGKNIVITNGMAKGIDYLSCKIAMKYSLPIIMFLGSGINYVYPSSSQEVYDYCKKGNGLVISEYPDDTLPIAAHFPFRNRLIATTSKKIILPEAKIRSGSYSTINRGLQLGKDIATFPASVNYKNSLNNILIQDGAQVVLNIDDLLSFIDFE